MFSIWANFAKLFWFSFHKACKVAVTIFVERKKWTNIIFLKIHSALTVALTEHLHEYKIVELKMAHLFYLGKFYLAFLV